MKSLGFEIASIDRRVYNVLKISFTVVLTSLMLYLGSLSFDKGNVNLLKAEAENPDQSTIIGGDVMSESIPGMLSMWVYDKYRVCGAALVKIYMQDVLTNTNSYVYAVTTANHCPKYYDPSVITFVGGLTNTSFYTDGLHAGGYYTISIERKNEYHDPNIWLGINDQVIYYLPEMTDEEANQIGYFETITQSIEVTDSTSVPVEVAGWGYTKVGGYKVGDDPNILRKVEVKLFTDEDAQNLYSDFHQNLEVAAGIKDLGGKDSCQGDSGGPLFISGYFLNTFQDLKKYDEGKLYILGNVSRGNSCATIYPGIYTKLSFHIPGFIDFVDKRGNPNTSTFSVYFPVIINNYKHGVIDEPPLPS